MPLTPRLLDEAKIELGHAVDHHDERQRGHGVAFFQAYEEALVYAIERPHAGSPFPLQRRVNRTIRKYQIGKFPCDLVVTLVNEELVVIAISPHRRRPGYWVRRLKHL